MFTSVTSQFKDLTRFYTKYWVPQSASRLLTLLGRTTYRRWCIATESARPNFFSWRPLRTRKLYGEKKRSDSGKFCALWTTSRTRGHSCDFGAKVPSSSTRSVALDTWHLFVWSSTQNVWCELIRLLALTMPLSISRICCTIMFYHVKVKALSSLQFHHFKCSHVFLLPTKLCKLWGAHRSAQLWGHEVNIG